MNFLPHTVPPGSKPTGPIVFVGGRTGTYFSNNSDVVDLTFTGGVPSCVAQYVDPPITDAVSGRQLDVAGNAFLQVRCPRVSAIVLDGTTKSSFDTHPGVTRFRNRTTRNVLEVVQTGYQGKVLTWTIGLRHKEAMAVALIEGEGLHFVAVVILQ